MRHGVLSSSICTTRSWAICRKVWRTQRAEDLDARAGTISRGVKCRQLSAPASRKLEAVTDTARELTMSFAGSLVKHLGLQMYSGAVPALAELVSNAWDADAEHVWLTVPLDEAITASTEISVQDDGEGMTFEDVRDKYLLLGRNRRATEGDHTDGGRPALGRKGIGKLAGFGIAKIVEVWTVRDGHLTAFEMDYDKITADKDTISSYRPKVLHDRPVTSADPSKGAPWSGSHGSS